MCALLELVVLKYSSIGPLSLYCTNLGPLFLLAICRMGGCRTLFVGRGRLATLYFAGNLRLKSSFGGHTCVDQSSSVGKCYVFTLTELHHKQHYYWTASFLYRDPTSPHSLVYDLKALPSTIQGLASLYFSIGDPRTIIVTLLPCLNPIISSITTGLPRFFIAIPHPPIY